jgi:GcrA cell cycle regulator
MTMRETMAKRRQWTPERIAEVRELWDAGLTLTAIGERLGISRGAVSGVVDRHGFTRRDEPERIREWKARGKVRLPPRPRVRRRVQQEIPPTGQRIGWQETGSGITLMQLKPMHCRWPVGEASGALQRFCGHEVVGGSVYCAGHGARAFVPGRVTRGMSRPAFQLRIP